MTKVSNASGWVVRAALAAAATLVCAVGAMAQSGDITGKWSMVFNTPDGPRPATITAKVEAGKLTGTIANEEGEIPLEGTVKDGVVEISFTYPTGNGPIPITMSGKISGDSFTGSFTAGGDPMGDFSGTRAAAKESKEAPAESKEPAKESKEAATLDVTGTWQFNVQTSAQSGTPTIVLKQSGETLTGEYQGQYGNSPLKGTIKGSDVNFTFDIDIQGTPLHVVYTGTAEKDAMKGRVAYGDMAEGVFTARRK
jgi:hypothetical protein